MKLALKLFLASAVSVVFLWLAFRDIDGRTLWATIQEVRGPYLALYLLALMATQVARAVRWQALVAPVCALPAAQAWRISNVGNMLIMLLPLRLGELSRPYMLRRSYNVPLAAGAGAALVERVLDGLIVTLMFFVTTAGVADAYPPSAALKAGALVALAIFSTALVVIVLTMRHQDGVAKLVQATLGRLWPQLADRVVSMLHTLVQGMRALPNFRAATTVVGYTLIYWLANALGMVALMHAFGWQLPWLAGFTVVCVLVIGVMIPAGPGLLGTYQAAIIAGLSTYGVPHNAAAAFSVVGYLGNLAVVVGCGAAHLVGKNMAEEMNDLVHADALE